MTSTPQRIHSPEFQREAVALAEQIGVTQAARQLGIGKSTIYEWRRRQSANGLVSVAPAPEDQSARIRQLEEELRVARMERDILKKATAFFAKDQT